MGRFFAAVVRCMGHDLALKNAHIYKVQASFREGEELLKSDELELVAGPHRPDEPADEDEASSEGEDDEVSQAASSSVAPTMVPRKSDARRRAVSDIEPI